MSALLRQAITGASDPARSNADLGRRASSGRRRWRGLVWLLGGCLASGCSSPDASPRAASGREAAQEPWVDGLPEGDAPSVLQALAQPHATVRTSLGPHRLQVTSTVSMTPQLPAGASSDQNPPVGQGVVTARSIEDKVSLVWTEGDDEGPRFSLEQHNDQDRGRSVVVADGRLFAKLEHRGWTAHALETDVHELWLDDAQRTAHDAVAFLLPAASVTAEALPGDGLGGGDAVRLTLARGESSLAPVSDGSWREGVAFDALSATIVVDVVSGAWLKLDARAEFRLSGSDGLPVAGVLEAHGEVTAANGGSLTVTPPPQVVALPERHRYEVERKRLLDGLVAP